MSEKTTSLLKAFDTLPPSEKLEFANAIYRKLPPIDSGPLDDEEVAADEDALAGMLTHEENGAETR